MGLIDFNKPTKVPNDYGFDGGPPGGYMPQMSDKDAKKWKGKRFNKGKNNDRIEIRKSFDECQILIIVAKNGWNYNSDIDTLDYGKWDQATRKYGSRGKNVRISMNGPLKLSFDEWNELTQVIEEAKVNLSDV